MKKRLMTILLVITVGMLSGCGKGADVNSNNGKADLEDTGLETETDSMDDDIEDKAENNEPAGNDAADNHETANNEKAADGENTQGTDSGSQNIYEVCTSVPKAEVEAFAAQVKQQIVSHDWKGLSGNISYPITVGDTTYQNSDEFAAGNFEDSLSQKFVDAVEAETCTDMFCNWQGIMLGNGEVWISEVLNDDSSSQGLKVTAINGMVE